MFTGIIEEVGAVQNVNRGRVSATLTINASKVTDGLKVGDSIAVNGVCLTVTSFDSGSFRADVMHETLDRSSLGLLKPMSRVNLERAMAANGRFGGHIVSGHVDGTGKIADIRRDDSAIWYTIMTSSKLLLYIVEKGSITVDGISLTVARAALDRFQVSVIPHTAAMTTLKDKRSGDIVNLETDIIGKYVEKLLQAEYLQDKEGAAFRQMASAKSVITRDFLSRNGF